MQQNVAILQLSVVSSGLEVHGFGTGLDEHLADGNGILRARGPCLGCAVRETEGVILTCQRRDLRNSAGDFVAFCLGRTGCVLCLPCQGFAKPTPERGCSCVSEPCFTS